MRSFAAAFACLSWVAIAGPAAAQAPAQPPVPAAERRVEAVFAIHARGVEAGEFTYNFTQSGQSYQVSAQRRTTGLVRMAVGSSQDYSYSVRGAVDNSGALRPSAYQHRGGRRNRVVNAAFSANDVVTTAQPAMGMGTPAANPGQRRGVIDQLTAIAALISARGDPCTRTLNVYMDGRSRFDFVLTANGTINVDNRAYRGQAIRCRVEFRPIAGFSDPQQRETLTFLFARTQSGLYAPIRIEMPTDNDGIVRLDARRLTVNGARLR
jgi:Protein of unknown function (DUF3108)